MFEFDLMQTSPRLLSHYLYWMGFSIGDKLGFPARRDDGWIGMTTDIASG
jgi:hypothetical protein